jgi:hypothetical protein
MAQARTHLKGGERMKKILLKWAEKRSEAHNATCREGEGSTPLLELRELLNRLISSWYSTYNQEELREAVLRLELSGTKGINNLGLDDTLDELDYYIEKDTSLEDVLEEAEMQDEPEG